MGLDQSFFKNRPQLNENGNFNWDEAKEVLYFRKFWGLHDKIGEVLNETLLNGKTYRLEPEDLVKIRDYIALDGINDYWAFESDDEEVDELPDNFNKAIGVLSRYIALNKPLYYNGDW